MPIKEKSLIKNTAEEQGRENLGGAQAAAAEGEPLLGFALADKRKTELKIENDWRLFKGAVSAAEKTSEAGEAAESVEKKLAQDLDSL